MNFEILTELRQIQIRRLDILLPQLVVVSPVLVLLQRNLLLHLFETLARRDRRFDFAFEVFKELDRQRYVGFRKEVAVAAGEGVEVERIDVFVGADPLGDGVAIHRTAGAGDGANVVAYQGVGDHVGGEDDAFCGEEHYGHVVAVVLAGVDQFNGFATERDSHALGVGEVGLDDVLLEFGRGYAAVFVGVHLVEEAGAHAADAGVGEGGDVDVFAVEVAVAVAVDHVAGHVGEAAIHVCQHAFLRDDRRCALEHGGAFDVVEVAVAVDDILHRHVEALGEFFLQPRGVGDVQWVGENDAFIRDEEDVVPYAVAGAVEVAGDGADLVAKSGRGGLFLSAESKRGEGAEHSGEQQGVKDEGLDHGGFRVLVVLAVSLSGLG